MGNFVLFLPLTYTYKLSKMTVPCILIKTQFYVQVRGKVKQKRDHQLDQYHNQLRRFHSLFFSVAFYVPAGKMRFAREK